MSKLKLATIVGTRPEIIRLSAVISACDKYFDQVLIHTGQNWDYTLNQVFFTYKKYQGRRLMDCLCVLSPKLFS